MNVLEMAARHLDLIGGAVLGSVAALSLWRKSRRQQLAREILENAIRAEAMEPMNLHPEIDVEKCLGCGACTKVCPEGDILLLIDHKAVLVAPSKCVGHGLCEAACPFGAIELVFGTKTRGIDMPRLSENYETNVPGLYIAGELGGMGLIANAIKQGRIAAAHALGATERKAPADCDLFIVGAGPAGMAAALEAIASDAKYICIEQNSFGGAVANYPRQKLVMTRPAELPIIGRLRFRRDKVTKEELLGQWELIRRRTGLRISERETFLNLRPQNGMFMVETSRGAYTARKVVLALGTQGSPRKLGLANEDHPKVAYRLIDPEQYRGRKVAVVGGGNSAAEAAQMLARPELGNTVTLVVKGAAMSRCNRENLAKVEALARAGRIELRYESRVEAIRATEIDLVGSGKRETLANDFLFVMAGTDAPYGFLESIGLEIERKHGEPFGKSASPPR